MKRVWEKIVEGIFDLQRFCNEHYYFADCRILVCGSFGTFLIKKVIEEGYVLAVNKAIRCRN